MKPIETAVIIATSAHAGTRDKSKRPYILHPLRVMTAMDIDDEDGQVVAVLHDVVEDTEVTLDAIRKAFSREIADAVEAISRRPGERYRAYVERCGRNPIAKRVKFADLADNLDPRRSFAGGHSLRRRYHESRNYLNNGSW